MEYEGEADEAEPIIGNKRDVVVEDVEEELDGRVGGLRKMLGTRRIE